MGSRCLVCPTVLVPVGRAGYLGPRERGSEMTAKEMARMIGCEFLLRVDAFVIVVTVDDVKMSYGVPRALVQPVGGMGAAWVAADRLRAYDSAVA
jgi:hypothetical protein